MKPLALIITLLLLGWVAATAIIWWWDNSRTPDDEELASIFQEDITEDPVNIRDINNYLQAAPSDLVPVNNNSGTPVASASVLPEDGNTMEKNETLPSEQDISISELGFTPEEVTVPRGGRIRFVNNGQGMHEPTQENLDGFEAGLLQTGDHYTFSWTEPGEWVVVDKYNEEAKLRVVVQ